MRFFEVSGDPRPSLYELFYPIDTIQFSLKARVPISPEAVDLYRKGWSLRDIAREYGCSKGKVMLALRKAGVPLRESIALPTSRRGVGKQGVLPYYGFCYSEGRIVRDPKEFPTLKLIHRLWKDKKTIHQITVALNRARIPSRKGKRWSWAAVRNIVERFGRGYKDADLM